MFCTAMLALVIYTTLLPEAFDKEAYEVGEAAKAARSNAAVKASLTRPLTPEEFANLTGNDREFVLKYGVTSPKQ